MCKIFFNALLFLGFAPFVMSQSVGIGTNAPNASAQLDVVSTNKGMLVPRMTTAQRTAIAAPASGLLVYDTDVSGFMYYNSSVWAQLSTTGSSSNQWTTTGTDISNNNSGNVGIGRPATTSKLSIAGSLALYSGSTNSGTIEPSGINLNMNAVYGTPLPLPGTPAGNLILQHSVFTSFPAGRVGIGNNAPEQKLHITGNAMMDGANPFITLRNGSTGTQKASLQLSGANLLIGTDAGNDGEVQLKQNGQVKFSVDAFGNIVQNNSNPYFTIQNNGINKAYFNVGGNDFGIGTYSGNTTGKIHFAINGSTRAEINALGNMGIGSLASSFYKLSVLGTTYMEASGNTSNALELYGTLKVGGARPTAFVVSAPANGTGFIIDNPVCNNDPNAILIVTGRNSHHSVYVNYNITENKWAIHLANPLYPLSFTNCFDMCGNSQPVELAKVYAAGISIGDKFNVLVIKQ